MWFLFWFEFPDLKETSRRERIGPLLPDCCTQHRTAPPHEWPWLVCASNLQSSFHLNPAYTDAWFEAWVPEQQLRTILKIKCRTRPQGNGTETRVALMWGSRLYSLEIHHMAIAIQPASFPWATHSLQGTDCYQGQILPSCLLCRSYPFLSFWFTIHCFFILTS